MKKTLINKIVELIELKDLMDIFHQHFDLIEMDDSELGDSCNDYQSANDYNYIVVKKGSNVEIKNLTAWKRHTSATVNGIKIEEIRDCDWYVTSDSNKYNVVYYALDKLEQCKDLMSKIKMVNNLEESVIFTFIEDTDCQLVQIIK